jgi:hypothetical protein
MFEGSDLNMAYGGMDNYQQPMLQPPMVQQQNQPVMMQQQPTKQMVSVQQPEDVVYQPPAEMYDKINTSKSPSKGRPGFIDRLAGKRVELMKVMMFAFIILFAISMDKLFTHYISQYISQSILTDTQELLIRAAYPVAILLVIWIVKAI